jgi:NAD(P)-dependent dehydrogenase (short-subunit alcohol dehydrogenase family)
MHDKVALVTGAASGMGAACARRFAAEGAAVVLADRTVGPAEELAASLRQAGGRARAVQYEATSDADARAAVAAAVEEFGGLHVLVTAAGIATVSPPAGDLLLDPLEGFLGAGVDEWNTILDVNLTGTFRLVQLAMAQMRAQGSGGAIVTISSIAAKQPEMSAPNAPAYGVSKAGVWMLTKMAARYGASAGIRVNAVGPGVIDTAMTAGLQSVPEALAYMIRDVPMARIGQADEVANAVFFLASDQASYITGEMLHPDGGYYTD